MTDLIPKNATLEHCETIIETNLAGAFAVASALSHIHDHKLYKATHKTWEVYCLERWQMSRSAAWRQIAQSRAVAELPAGSSAPSQRSLAKRPEQNVAHPPSEPPVTRDKAPKVRDEKSKPKSVVIDVESTDVPKSPEPSSALRIAELESEIVRLKAEIKRLEAELEKRPPFTHELRSPDPDPNAVKRKSAKVAGTSKKAAAAYAPATTGKFCRHPVSRVRDGKCGMCGEKV